MRSTFAPLQILSFTTILQLAAGSPIVLNRGDGNAIGGAEVDPNVHQNLGHGSAEGYAGRGSINYPGKPIIHLREDGSAIDYLCLAILRAFQRRFSLRELIVYEYERVAGRLLGFPGINFAQPHVIDAANAEVASSTARVTTAAVYRKRSLKN
ncbi:hypothetical protein C8J57DRAFT_1247705 [Mycena rebaudengoi]|nr:hypothetical protein C8J57DRAFT_1247705 [Mycena rebaudengoi]